MLDFAKQLLGMGPHPVVQVAACPEQHYAYVHAVEGTQPEAPHELASQGAARVSGHHPLVDHGGSVIKQVRIVLIYLGQMWFDVPRTEAFVTALVRDGYLDKLAPLGVGRGTLHGAVQLPGLGSKTTDAEIQQLLRNIIANGQVPAPDGNTLYVCCTEAGCEIDMGNGSLNCEAWCGYHSALDEQTFYAVQPCTLCAGCNQGDAYAGFTMVLAHEIAEACSDAFPGQGWYVDEAGPYAGWENGDMAAWPDPAPTYAGEAVQAYWTGDAPDMGDYVPPAPVQPFVSSLGFWQWVVANYPQVLTDLARDDTDLAHQAIFTAWNAWFIKNGYLTPA